MEEPDEGERRYHAVVDAGMHRNGTPDLEALFGVGCRKAEFVCYVRYEPRIEVAVRVNMTPERRAAFAREGVRLYDSAEELSDAVYTYDAEHAPTCAGAALRLCLWSGRGEGERWALTCTGCRAVFKLPPNELKRLRLDLEASDDARFDALRTAIRRSAEVLDSGRTVMLDEHGKPTTLQALAERLCGPPSSRVEHLMDDLS